MSMPNYLKQSFEKISKITKFVHPLKFLRSIYNQKFHLAAFKLILDKVLKFIFILSSLAGENLILL